MWRVRLACFFNRSGAELSIRIYFLLQHSLLVPLSSPISTTGGTAGRSKDCESIITSTTERSILQGPLFSKGIDMREKGKRWKLSKKIRVDSGWVVKQTKVVDKGRGAVLSTALDS